MWIDEKGLSGVSIEWPALGACIIHKYPCVLCFLLHIGKGGDRKGMQPAASAECLPAQGQRLEEGGEPHAWGPISPYRNLDQ